VSQDNAAEIRYLTKYLVFGQVEMQGGSDNTSVLVICLNQVDNFASIFHSDT
jgi:hypothetical protein